MSNVFDVLVNGVADFIGCLVGCSASRPCHGFDEEDEDSSCAVFGFPGNVMSPRSMLATLERQPAVSLH